MKQIFFAEVKDGVAKIQNRKGYEEFIKFFEGKWVQFTIEKKSKKRSTKQNAYLHGVVYPIILQGFKDAGWAEIKTVADVHEAMKLKFLKRTIVSEHGEEMEIIRSSTTLTTTEFMDYIAELQQFGAEFLNIYIPDPLEQTELEWNK